MFKSNFNQSSTSTQSESQIVTFPLQPANANSDIDTLSEVNTETPQSQILQDEYFLENLLSNLLKYGVFIASTIVLLGGILYLIRHGAEPAEYHFFHGESSEFCSPTSVVTAALSGSRRGIIQLGLLLLVATPILRVLVSLLVFAKQRNWNYVMITTLVMTALVCSFVRAYF
ncbi:MAG: DUF1634 domain-containing protein [Iphinoe sp. HA4291-MV1]|jgi:uncharacterized membrane protein|nr:DUF1634 domain-containing protein [Iphinoe sp. HA4291-MV1]